MFAAGAWEAGQCRNWVCKAFLVPKPDNPDGSKNWRIIVDLRPINAFCEAMGFKMETLGKLSEMGLEKDSLMWSFGVKDGFYAVGVDPKHRGRDFFCFELPDGTLVRYASLPMGWSHSPAIFGELMAVLTRRLRSPGAPVARQLLQTEPTTVPRVGGRRQRLVKVITVKPAEEKEALRTAVEVLPYCDDFLCWLPGKQGVRTAAGATPTAVIIARDRVQSILDELGITRHPKKGFWEPTTRVQHLGLIVDTHLGLYQVSAQKMAKIRGFARSIVCRTARNRRLVPARVLASFTGLVQSVYLALPVARMFERTLHDVLASKSHWEANVRLTKTARRDLEWWSVLPAKWNGRRIWRRSATRKLYSDASMFAWGGHLVGDQAKTAHGMFHGLEKEHITVKELRATQHTVSAFAPELAGHHVQFEEDNQAVVYIVRSRTSRDHVLFKLVRRFYACSIFTRSRSTCDTVLRR